MQIRPIISVWMPLVWAVSLVPSVEAQTCKHKNTLPLTPTKDFKSHQDGTVTHLKTGLMWQVCSLGQNWQKGKCVGKAKAMTWQQAMLTTQQQNQQGGYAGHSDWRLPNFKELKSIVEYQCFDPAINQRVFPNTPSEYYWSSTPDVDSRYGAFGIGFDRGESFSDYRDDYYFIRLVRETH
ncbi:DUF1566 domain-containing protein [Hydrogenovibrio sp. SC-1]|uniref:Lcl C-terminal domain-containing protein n=1 Tax=Hydrogenovibrio sp. SC-1 TaxID=2065820 RepID=UPI001304291A|nr:DUF1566 domain-containing protein [Hydrogenovibrio sp. SC-1]